MATVTFLSTTLWPPSSLMSHSMVQVHAFRMIGFTDTCQWTFCGPISYISIVENLFVLSKPHSHILLGTTQLNKTVVVQCNNTAAVGMFNKTSISHPVMMQFLRWLFWLSATFNFPLKAYNIPGSANYEADHTSWLHKPEHCFAFCFLITGHGVKIFPIPACNHMFLDSFHFLKGRHS